MCFIKAHPLKMAYTAAKYNSSKGIFEVGHRVFQDDFEATLSQYYNYKGGDVFEKQDNSMVRQSINLFFDKNFSFFINKKKLPMSFNKIEQKGDMGIIVWYESAKIATTSIKSVHIFNAIMMDSFKEQVNMFHLNINNIKRTLKFEYHHKEEIISINDN
jgi:hypothetical protein